MRFLYHAFSDKPGLNSCSMKSDEAPLIVNCAGNISCEKPFVTDNPVGREDFYLMYILKGKISVSLSDGEKNASAGDVLIFPPRFCYRYSYLGKEPLEYTFIHFTGSYAERLLELCGLYPLPFLHSTDCDRFVSDSFRRFLECTEKTSYLQKYELAAILEQALLSIAAQLTKKTSGRTFESSLHIMHTAYHSDIRVPELARAENLSHSRYVELFRAQLGMSPMAYLIRLRMQAACSLLETTDMPISHIANMVSYDDPHFFSKLFKKHVGISPKDYKKEKIQNMIHNI